jgi:hypothetical protein
MESKEEFTGVTGHFIHFRRSRKLSVEMRM